MGGFIFSGVMGGRRDQKGQFPLGKDSLLRLARHAFESLSGLTPQTNGRDLYEVIHIDTALGHKCADYTDSGFFT